MGIGKKLSDKINQKGLTKKQVAEAAKVPATTLYSIIQRDNTKVEIDAFLRICSVLECVPEEFASDIPTNILNKNDILTVAEKRLLDVFKDFNDDGKNEVIRYADYLSTKDEYKKGSATQQEDVLRKLGGYVGNSEQEEESNNPAKEQSSSERKFTIRAARGGEQIGRVETNAEIDEMLSALPEEDWDL